MYLRFFSTSSLLCIAILLCCGVSRIEALDNVNGYDYGQIGPVMYYDPNTGQSTPFLPIGWYFWWPHSGTLLDEVAASGGNTVLFADNDDAVPWMFGETGAGLDRAQELGLKVIVGFRGVAMLMGVNYNDPASYSHLIPWIQAYRDHPALLGWQLGDENGGDLTAQMINDAARVFKRNDPHHQIWQVFTIHDDGAKLINYMQQTDIASFDRYGYFDSTVPFGGADWIIELQNEKAGLGANNGWNGNVNVVQGLGCDTGGFDYYRFPDYDEYRHLVFSAFASAGVRGTLSWVYYYNDINWYTDPNLFTNWRDNICQPIQLEQQMIAHAMETGWNVGSVAANTDGQYLNGPTGYPYGKVSHLLTYDDIQEFYYLIVSNNSYETINVELTLTELPDAITSLVAEIPESSSTVVMQDLGGGDFRLNDTLLDHDVKIYLLRADGEPNYCGDFGTVYFDADLVPDCYVKFDDFALLASEWLYCTDPTDSNCDLYWSTQFSSTVYTDNFNRADGELQLGSDWEIGNGGKNWHLIDSNKLKIRGADPSGADNAVCDVYVGALHAGEGYQRASIDYMPRSSGYAPQAGVHLNFDGRNHYYFAENSYRLSIRGNKDMQVVKLGPGGVEEFTSGWFAFAGGDLVIDTWYRMTLERFGNILTGTVTSLDGLTQYGQLSITDTGTVHTGGWVAITDYYGISANSVYWDNFEYEVGTQQNPSSCGSDGTVYLDADLYQDCYVNFSDIDTFASQWLWCSDPNESDCDVYWK